MLSSRAIHSAPRYELPQCHRCSRMGHTYDDCVAKRDIYGNKLGCSRCHRKNHSSKECYAVYHLDGYYIVGCPFCGRRNHEAKDCHATFDILGNEVDKDRINRSLILSQTNDETIDIIIASHEGYFGDWIPTPSPPTLHQIINFIALLEERLKGYGDYPSEEDNELSEEDEDTCTSDEDTLISDDEEEDIEDDSYQTITIPSFKFGPKTELSETLCAICLCDYQLDDTLSTLSCIHHFHQQCIMEWFKVKLTCPLCNTSLL